MLAARHIPPDYAQVRDKKYVSVVGGGVQILLAFIGDAHFDSVLACDKDEKHLWRMSANAAVRVLAIVAVRTLPIPSSLDGCRYGCRFIPSVFIHLAHCSK